MKEGRQHELQNTSRATLARHTMPLKIKLTAPVTTANIALTNLAELAKANAPSQSYSDRDDDEASCFPLPPQPHQGHRNHAEFPSDVTANHEIMATDLSNGGRRNQNSHAVEFLQPNNHQQPPTEFDFSENNYATAAAGRYNSQPHWQEHQHQTEHQPAVNNPMEMNQAGYKDFLPPPIHVPKNTEKGYNGSAFVRRMNGHDSSSNNMAENSNNHDVYQQQQQHPVLPPLPQKGVEKETYEKEKSEELLENSKRNGIAPSDSAEMNEQRQDTVPVYAYSTLHQQKSWNDMIELFTKFIDEVNGHENVEKMENGKISAHDGSNQVDGDNNDDHAEETLLMFRSWVRELRYIRDADDSVLLENSSKKRSTKQQQRCDSENLTPERISELNKLSFPWKNNLTQWQKWLDDLMHYRAKNNGSCNVPFKFPEHPPLGNFVNKQRVEYKKMLQRKSSTMTTTKIEDLERIGFGWSVRRGGHTSWDDRLAELVAYKRERGNTLVPKKYPANPPLGYWVNEQRFQYQRHINGKSSTMNKKRQESLNRINFKWSLREAPREFPEWIKILKEYKSQLGNCNVPLKYEHDVSLGSFVNNTRTQYKKFQSGLQSNMNQEKM